MAAASFLTTHVGHLIHFLTSNAKRNERKTPQLLLLLLHRGTDWTFRAAVLRVQHTKSYT